MGIGAALIFPATLAILINVFTDPIERAKAIAIWSATSGLSVAARPGHRRLAARALLVGIGVPRQRPDRDPRHAAGGPLRADEPRPARAAVRPARHGAVDRRRSTALVWAIIEAPDHGWTSTASLAGFGAGIALLGAFIVWERRIDHPMLDVDVFRRPAVLAPAACRSRRVLRPVRVHLPGHPVLPVRPRLQPAVGRRAHRARSPCSRHRRADSARLVQPLRHEGGRDRRPALDGDRVR